MGRARGSSRNFRHKQPVGHAFLKVSDYRCLSPWDRDRERLTCGRSELDDIRAVSLRAVDHDTVLAACHGGCEHFENELEGFGRDCSARMGFVITP